MSREIKKNKLTERVNKVFKERFQIDLFSKQLNVTLNDNIFADKFRLKARDLLYLVSDLESEFGIQISDEDINELKINTIGNILYVVEKESEGVFAYNSMES